jgi:hypothetical protein
VLSSGKNAASYSAAANRGLRPRRFGGGATTSGPQVSVALPALRPVAPPDALRPPWRIVAGRGSKSPAKSKLLRCCGCTGHSRAADALRLPRL